MSDRPSISALTRRQLLSSLGVTAGAGLFASGLLGPLSSWRRLAEAAEPARAGGGTLVVLFLRGGADGLNLLVPHGDPAYYAARPSVAIPAPVPGQAVAGAALDLDGFFGLHPALDALKPLYDSGQLLPLHAVGSHHPTRSHFEAQDFMEMGAPGAARRSEGWLNRCLQQLPALQRAQLKPAGGPTGNRGDEFRAVAFSTRLPLALQGKAPVLAVPKLDDLAIRGAGKAPLDRLFEAEYAKAADALLGRSGKKAFGAARTAASVRASAATGAGGAGGAAAGGAGYPEGPLGKALAQVAELLRADLGTRIAFVEAGGWDTHVRQGAAEGQLAGRLRPLGQAMAAFARDVGPERLARTTLVAMTEFGRAVGENGNGGTDHGHGSAMLILGGGVRGRRVHARWPGLHPDQRFERRDLAVTTDFRDVLAEVAGHVLGVRRLDSVLPGHHPKKLGLFA